MTTRELARRLRARLGDRQLLDLAGQMHGRRTRFPAPRTVRTVVLDAILQRAARLGWSAARSVQELRGIGLTYGREYVIERMSALGLRRRDRRRMAAGRTVR